MKYVCQMSSRADYQGAVEQKHEKIISSMKNVNGSLGIKNFAALSTPVFKDHFQAFVNIRGKMRDISSGFLSYRLRESLEDEHSSDDRIYFDFLTKKVRFFHFIDVVHRYLQDFDAYRMIVYPENILFTEKVRNAPFEITSGLNYRKDIKIFASIQYMDKIFIERAFRCDPLDLCITLKKEVRNVELFNEGVFI